MHHKKGFLIVLFLLVSSLYVLQAQTFDLGCLTQDDATLGIDRKDWNGGNSSGHSDGAMLNFTLPSNTFGGCKKITEVTFVVTINGVDLSGVPAGCLPAVYYLNSYTDANLPFDAASIPTSQILGEDFDPDLFGLSGSYTFICDGSTQFDFDGEVGMDIIPVIDPACIEFQNMVVGGFIILDYSICVSGVVGDAGPVPDVNAGTVDSEVCLGQDIGFFESGNDATMWAWEGPTGWTSSAENPVILLSDAGDIGTYGVTVTDDFGCTNTDEVIITAAPEPDAMADALTTSVCPGDDIQLQENGGDAEMWSWTGPNGFFSPDQNPLISPSTSADLGTYFVIVTDAGGCTNTSEVTINSAPLPVTIADALFTEVCPGQDIQLQENGGEGSMWSWDGPDSFTSIENNPTITSSTADNLGMYNVTVTDAGGCTNTGSVTISAGTEPNADADAVQFSVCEGQDIMLLEIGGEADSWNWTGPNGFISIDQNPININATLADLGTYTVEVTDAGGCTNTSQVNITLADSPTGCITGNGALCENQCDGASPVFTFELTPTSGNFDIELTFPGTSFANFTLTDIADGQNISVCSDALAGAVDFDGLNLILPTGSITDGTTIVIEIAGLFDTNNPNCLGIPDPGCQVEIEYTTAANPLIEFDGNILMDGDILTCQTGFDPVLDITDIEGVWSIDGDVITIPEDLTAYPPGNHTLTFTPDADQCSFISEVEIEIAPCANCVITDAFLSNVICNDNDTDTDETDDFISFSLDPQAIFEGVGYIVSVSAGTISPTTGTYGAPNDFQLQNGSAGGGDIILTIQDVDDVTCFVEITIIDTGTCSGACNLSSAVLNLVACSANGTTGDPADDYIVFELEVDGINTSGNYSFDSPYGMFIGPYGVNTNFQFPGGSAGAGDLVLTIVDNGDPTCTITVTLEDPGTCSGACTLLPNVASNIACNDNDTPNNPDDDFLSFDLDPQGSNLTGDYTITSTNGISPASGSFGSSSTFTVSSILPTGGTFMVTIISVDDPLCMDTFEITDPGPCSTGCPDPGTCDDGVCANGEEVWDDAICDCLAINIPDPTSCVDDDDCSNGIEIWNDQNCECEVTITTLGCINPTANNYDPLATCDDGSCEFDCADPGDCDNGDCTDGEEVWDGTDCECVSINIPDPATCVDDTDCSNGEEVWNDTICECEQLNIPDPSTCLDDGNCSNGTETWNVQTCECENITTIIATVGDISCDPNNTGSDSTDDIIIFELQVEGPEDGTGYNFISSGGFFFGEYGVIEEFEMAAGSAGNGNFTITILDTDDPSCPVEVTIFDPGVCSADCITSVDVIEVKCFTNQTASTTFDDFLTVTFNLITTMTGSFSISTNFDTSPDFGTFGNTTTFATGMLNQNGGILLITIVSDDDPNCFFTFEVVDPGPCSIECNDPGDCDDGDACNGEETWNGDTCECNSDGIGPDPDECVDDGDCSNGEEVWNDTTCECMTENFIDPETCVDDGDCTNGIEMWDDEICECSIEEPVDCAEGGIQMECDDNDSCTVNDMMTMDACTNEICIPCLGVLLDCAIENNLVVQNCDDGSEFTENDIETILECDGSICIPCEGQLVSPNIFFPQIFTPDGDGDNDKYGLYSNQEFLIKEFKIYNRWGELMYEVLNVMSSDESHRWNGRFNNSRVNPGVYVYYVELGEPFNSIEVGDLTLVY